MRQSSICSLQKWGMCIQCIQYTVLQELRRWFLGNMFFHTTYTSYHENYWILGHHIPGSIQQKSKRPRSVGIDRGSPRWRIDRWGTASAPRKLWNWWNAHREMSRMIGCFNLNPRTCWIFEYLGYIIWYYFSHGVWLCWCPLTLNSCSPDTSNLNL